MEGILATACSTNTWLCHKLNCVYVIDSMC